jgi:S-adenosylmethionine:tRNA ribosyltransferase-isomerase
VDLAAFDYDLPADRIAQVPAASREASRLLVIDRRRRRFADRLLAELPDLLRPGDCMLVNDSRVIPARVLARAVPGGGAVELLFVEAPAADRARALVRPGRRATPGRALVVGGEGGPRLRVVGVEADGVRVIERSDGGTIASLLDVHGAPPLPPYIERPAGPADAERYQTVYARHPGSVAAPTAGLHFTPALLDRLRAAGVEVHALTLHVGLATFRPIRTRRIEDHVLPPERVRVPADVALAVNAARREGRRVVAVGTTTTRALEGAAAAGGVVEPCDRAVDLFIRPGHRFQVVDALLTNFHLPRSSLLVLVAAFAGRELILEAYRHALDAGYRFYSYGDATLIE